MVGFMNYRFASLGILSLGVLLPMSLVALSACKDSSAEEKATAELSASCVLNSECKSPLVCAFTRCHEQCAEDRDCPSGQRCLAGDEDSITKGEHEPGVCQPPREQPCTRDRQCEVNQFCAQDGECRNECEADGDCLKNQICTPSGACANEEELEENGDLPTLDDEPGSTDALSDMETEAGAPDASSTEPVEDPEPPAPEAGVDDTSSDTDEPIDAAVPPTDLTDDPPAPEAGTEPDVPPPPGDTCNEPDIGNDDRDTATPYTFGTNVPGCLQSAEDVDFFEFTTPAEPIQGGYLLVNVKDVGATGGHQLTLFSGVDNGQIRNQTSTTGANSAIWIPSAPNQLYRARVQRYSAIPPNYVFWADYVGVEDEHEPNDTQATAVPIQLGQEIRGRLFRGHSSSTAPTREADWFQVELAAGTVVATLDQAPEFAAYIRLYNAAGAQVANQYGAAGVDITFTRDSLDRGTYYFAVEHYSGGIVSGNGTVLPEIDSTPYVFTVTQ